MEEKEAKKNEMKEEEGMRYVKQKDKEKS